ncbi:MAG: ABC transporter ATP-binding protein [Dehalococcoidia bacterium]|nr:ABC transporter ATP-binding protein [Dehalococcoidia bacterium]
MPVIELKDITKTYKIGQQQVQALRGVSLTIERGEMVAMMGPSGSGKSTLMNILGCLDRPSTGTFLLDGVPVQSLGDDALAGIRNRKLGFVFQSYNLLPRASALANVELPMVYGGGKRKRDKAMKALERMGLKDRVSHRPSELSGGEQQRVAIARALANDPSVILADEPTGNLDSKTSWEILALFQELHRQEGITILIVTHEIDIAACAQRLVRLRDGKIVGEERIAPRLASEALLQMRGASQ